MDKIKLKMTYNQLKVVNGCLAGIDKIQSNESHHRCAKSILIDLAKRLLKKQIDKKDSSKPFAVNLKYHEAYYLEMIINGVHGTVNDDTLVFEKNLMLKTINELNQALA